MHAQADPVGRSLLMGRAARIRPERLAEKLLQVRLSLGLSQSELLRRLAVEDLIEYTKISAYERGEREPPLPILLQYARVANVYVEVLIDDDLDLPSELPSRTKSEGVRRASANRTRGRKH